MAGQAMREVVIDAAGANGTEWRGRFHVWAGTSERAYALVEDEDGRIRDVRAEYLRFDPPATPATEGT